MPPSARIGPLRRGAGLHHAPTSREDYLSRHGLKCLTALSLGSTSPTAIFTAWLHPQVTCRKPRLGKAQSDGANCREGTSHCNANMRFSSADQPVALIANFQLQTTSHRHRTATLQIPHALPRTPAWQGNLGLSSTQALQETMSRRQATTAQRHIALQDYTIHTQPHMCAQHMHTHTHYTITGGGQVGYVCVFERKFATRSDSSAQPPGFAYNAEAACRLPPSIRAIGCEVIRALSVSTRPRQPFAQRIQLTKARLSWLHERTCIFA